MPKSSTLLALAWLLGLTAVHAQLSISEFVADNDGGLLDEDGEAADWIEIHNAGDSAASLSGHYLTDDSGVLSKWALPDITIGPGGYRVVFASAKDRAPADGELHTNFSLSAGGEYLALVAPDAATVLSEFAPEYPDQFYGTSYGTAPVSAGSTSEVLVPWPAPATWLAPSADIGTDWRDPGFDDGAWDTAQTGIGFGYSFPGFVGAGGDTRTAMFGTTASCYIRIPFTVDSPADVVAATLEAHFDDGFVAYLNGAEVARENFTGTPSFDSRASGSEEVGEGDAMVAYPLDSSGKLVAGTNVLAFQLMNVSPSGSDVLMVPKLTAEILAGGGTETGYLGAPTPDAPNGPVVFSDFVRDTSFDIDRGFFDTPFDVTITCSTPGATIVYTTDGGTPTLANGIQAPAADADTPPVAVVAIDTSTPLRAAAFKDGLRPSNVDTQTYLFLDDVLDQPAQPPGYPLPWRGRSGSSIPGDFEMDPAVVGPVYSREELKTSLRSLPTVSIVTDIGNLFDQATGIQVNPTDAGEASERRVSVEMLDFADGAPVQLDAGMRMNGNASRSTNRGKHNFRLAFRNRYGAGKLNFPLFGSDAATETFNQIILRGGNGNSWVHPTVSVRRYAMYIRDQWFRDAHFAMGHPEALQREVHVYFNGLYFGLHHLFERIEEEWAAERFGGSEDDWEGFRIVGGNNIEVISGTPAEESARMLDSWRAALDAAEVGDLATFEQIVDLDAFIDYLLLNFHAANNDWDQNNVRAMRRRIPDGKYQFYCHDAERAGFNALNTANINLDVSTKNTANGPTQMNTDLRSHPASRDEYRLRFADRAYKHLFNGGALTAENGMAQWAARAAGIRDGLKAESARWGDHADSTPRTLVDFDAALEREYTQWFPARTPVTLSQLRSTGLYPDIDPPVFNQHGGAVATGFPVVISNSGGEIYYTADGSDPRLPGGGTNPDAIQLDGSLVTTEQLAAGSDWLYLDDGTDQGTAWRGVGFDDTGWPSGAAPLGYGDIDGSLPETTINVPERFLTNYFRTTINIASAATLTSAAIEIMADGGAVAYLNGTEIARDNMPAGLISFDTKSSDDGSPEGQFNRYSFDPTLFVEGANLIAVESHNLSINSSDMVMDARIETVGLNPDGGSIPIAQTTTLRARSLENGVWSALAEATFITGAPATSANIAISELHYNPNGPDEGNEFIEIMNISGGPVSLAGAAFTSGVEFAFADADSLAAGARLVLGTADYEGQLNNGGETITLTAGDGTVIRSFRYEDDAPWPLTADGDGYSLTLIAPETSPDHGAPSNWRASVAPAGSPGGSDAVAFSGSTPAELLAHALGSPDATIGVQFQTVAVDGSPDDYLVLAAPRNAAADDVVFDIQFSSDLETWQDGAAVFLSSGATGGATTLSTWRASAPLAVPGSPTFARLVLSLRAQ